jgi:FtsP/CotA-like multicopper oxidase with cupredoxin domain
LQKFSQTIVVPNGGYIDKLPSARRLQVGTGPNTALILTPATITGAANVTFKTPVYRSLDGEINVFGPTIRVKAGETMEIEVFNNLTQSTQASDDAHSYYDPMYTNMHTHGKVLTCFLSSAQYYTASIRLYHFVNFASYTQCRSS